MRYWHPLSGETAAALREWGADRIVLLPLYPQYSTTTTASSLKDWQRAAAAVGLDAPTAAVCCYPTAPGFIRAVTKLTRAALDAAEANRPRVLFSAHGLPRKVVDRGDPYRWQVDRKSTRLNSSH